jgi:large subunit ribosomal protein L25
MDAPGLLLGEYVYENEGAGFVLYCTYMTITLNVSKRDAKLSVDQVRAAGNVPAVLYGATYPTLGVCVGVKEIESLLKTAGESTIITINGLESPVDVLIKDVSFNPVKQMIQHLDFYVVEKGKEITTHVPLVFVGVAPIEDSGLGSITKVLQEVTVTCKPNKLPSHIDVDISSLEAIHDKLSVSDIKVPAGVTIDTDAHEAVVVVSENKAVEPESTTESTDAAEVPVVE